jgi:hypothetical protein
MATKVGEGYIEIKPRLVGFNRDLLREARKRIKDLEDASKEAMASVSVKPRITGITKIWQREIQKELNDKINGLTVDVKVQLDNQALKATFNGFTVSAKSSSAQAANAFNKNIDGIVQAVKRDMREVETDVRTGLQAFDSQKVTAFAEGAGDALRDLARNTEQLSDSQVTSVRNAVREHESLNKLLSNESKKAVSDYEREIEKAIKATDKMVESIMSKRPEIGTDKGSSVWGLAKSLNDEIDDVNALVFSAFPDLNAQLAQQATKSGTSFSGAFFKAFRANFFDNVSETLLTLGFRLGAAALTANPLLGALSNLAGGMVALGTVVVDLYGAFLALPAVWAAVAQAGGVLTAAFSGISEALTAVQNEEQHAAANSAVQARQIASAQEQVADAKERLKRSVESANEGIARSEQALTDAMASAARRISDAQDNVARAAADAAEGVERANERIADAQRALSRAYESASERIANAEERHADSIRRVRDAQLELNDAYKEAMERFEDLNVSLGNAILDEEGAKLAIERAKERLDETVGDPKATDLDKREAKHAYEEALQRLAEIQERQNDLREEVEEANRTGVEGSKEVTDARQKILDAQQAEIEAQADIAKAHQEAAQIISDAQERVAQAHADAARAQMDGVERIQEAEKDLAEARADAVKDVQRAQADVAKAHKDADRAIADSQKAVKRAIDGLTEAQTKQNEQWYNAQYAMSLLSPEAQKFVRFLADTFIPRLREVQFAIQDSFFPPIQTALSQSGGLIDLFQAKLAVTAGLFGTLIGETITWLNTPETQNSLGNILDSNNRLFSLLGSAGQNFGEVLLVLAEDAGPFLEDMGKLVLDFSQWISEIAQSEEGRQELATFFQNVSDTIHDIYDIAKLVGGVLYEVYKMARPYGQELLEDIKGIAKEFSDWANSKEGRKDIEKFLKNGKEFLSEIFKLIEDVAKAFFDFGVNNNLSPLIASLRDDLLPAILRVVDAFGGGSGGGGFIFLIKVISVAVDALSGSISLLAALVSGIGAIFTGDWSGARASFADFLDSVRGSALTVFGESLPDSFRQSSQAFNESVRGMSEDQGRVSLGFSNLDNDTNTWSATTSTATGRVSLDYSNMANDVGVSTGRYATDVDAKTLEAKTKAEHNSKAAKEAVLLQMEQMRLENAAKMEDYRKTVDTKTADAKTASNRNIGDIVKDAATLMIPFSGVFFEAAKEAQRVIANPGASWWDVGKAVIDGLWNGVKAFIPNFLTSIWNLGVDIINTINRALGNSSPSKKAFSSGVNVGEGLSLGIESMTGKVTKATKGLGRAVTDAFGSPSLNVDVGASGSKVVPTLGSVNASGIEGGARNVNYITVHAAPTIPTEKQISNVLKYQEALYS